MTTLTQETFLGASITSFNANLGWGSNVSTLQVSLVEDPKNNDEFFAVAGAPARFIYQNWRFDGIISTIDKNNSFSGKPTFSVTLIDPRQILDGSQVILDGYNGGTFSVPNLYNVFGYLENTLGFGGSLRNSIGMPWIIARNAIQALVNSSPLKLRGYSYFLDLSGLPGNLPETYRVPGDSISILEFIKNVCDAAACDFFVALVGNTIRIVTISRRNQPTLGMINYFVSQLSNGSVSNNNGLQLEDNVASKFLVGAQQERIYYVETNNGINLDNGQFLNPNLPPQNKTIVDYVGLDDDGNVNLVNRVDRDSGKDDENGNPLLFANYEFSMSASLFQWVTNNNGNPIFGGGYNTDYREMRAALLGQEDWEAFLIANNNLVGPHQNKATILKLNANVARNVNRNLNGRVDARQLRQMIVAFNNGRNFGRADHLKMIEELQAAFFNIIREFAEEHLGKKFMVQLPFVLVKAVPEEGVQQVQPPINQLQRLVTSVEPIPSAYLEEAAFPNAINNGLLPNSMKYFLDDNGKIFCYVKFEQVELDNNNLDLSELPNESFHIQQVGNNTTLYVKCEVSPSIVYLNRNNFFSPRVVVTLPGAVKAVRVNRVAAFGRWAMHRFVGQVDNPPTAAQQLLINDYNTFMEQVRTRFGNELLNFGNSYRWFSPDSAAIPLKSNVLNYGPWYAIGAQGRVEVEVNEQLAPWTFGGWRGMNEAANAIVSESLSNRQVSESGEVEIPDVPTASLGAALVNGGPYVSQVSVTIGSEGVKTKYRMDSWNVKPGGRSRFLLERMEKMAQLRVLQRRALRDLFQPDRIVQKNFINHRNINGQIKRVNRNRPGSSHHIIGADVISSHDEEKLSISNTVTLPVHNLDAPLSSNTENWKEKGGMSMDGLFRPFSTDVNAGSGMMSIIETIDEEHNVTGDREKINPFYSVDDETGLQVSDSDIELVFFDGVDGVPKNMIEPSGTLRPMSYKSPLWLTGFAYGVDGLPYPRTENVDLESNSSATEDEYVYNYKNKQHLWKSGPLDIRWDRRKKVYRPQRTLVFSIDSNLEGVMNGDNDGYYYFTLPFTENPHPDIPLSSVSEELDNDFLYFTEANNYLFDISLSITSNTSGYTSLGGLPRYSLDMFYRRPIGGEFVNTGKAQNYVDINPMDDRGNPLSQTIKGYGHSNHKFMFAPEKESWIKFGVRHNIIYTETFGAPNSFTVFLNITLHKTEESSSTTYGV